MRQRGRFGKAKKAVTNAVAVNSIQEEDAVENRCVGCQTSAALVDLDQDPDSQILFANRWADSHFVCVTCAFHGKLLSQLRQSLDKTSYRSLKNCLVCCGTGCLLELGQVEGAVQALSHPVIKADTICRIAVPTRRVCTDCAYALQWLYKQSLKIYVKSPGTSSRVATPEHPQLRINIQPTDIENVYTKSSRTNARGRRALEPSASTRPSRRANNLTPSPPPAPRNSNMKKNEKTKPIPIKEQEQTRVRSKRKEPSEVRVSEEENVVPAKRTRQTEKPQPIEKQEVLRTRGTRRVVAPVRFESTQSPQKATTVTKGRENRMIDRANKKNGIDKKSKTQLSKPKPRSQRLLKQELVEYECDVCSQMFYSGVTFGLHKLEHDGRSFKIQLMKCAIPQSALGKNTSPTSPTLNSSSSDDIDDDGPSSLESRRKPRKSLKPLKNAAKKRLGDGDNATSNFVFVAPLRVSCPDNDDDAKIGKDSVNYGFEKPIMLTPNANEFSDEEEEQSGESVTNCLNSLDKPDSPQNKTSEESSTTDTENTQEKEKDTDTSNNDNENNGEAANNDTANSTTDVEESPKQINVNQVLSFDFESPPSAKPTKTPASKKLIPDTSTTKSNCLKFDFEEPIESKHDSEQTESSVVNTSTSDKSTPGKDVSESSDYQSVEDNDLVHEEDNNLVHEEDNNLVHEEDNTVEAPTVSSDSHLNTEEDEFMPRSNVDPSTALRDDSTNPILPADEHVNYPGELDSAVLEQAVAE